MHSLGDNLVARRPTHTVVSRIVVQVMAATSVCVAVVFGQATMISLGPVSWGSVGDPTGVSADGSVVGVTVNGYDGQQHPCRWTQEGGFQDLGTMPGGHWAVVTGISADGTTLIGWGDIFYNGGYPIEGFRWTPAGGVQPSGVHESQFNGVNGDGTVVAGGRGVATCLGNPYGEGFRWSVFAGFQAMPSCADQWLDTGAAGVSVDGTVVVGTGIPPIPGWWRAFRWTVEGGIQDLGTLATGPQAISSATAVSADGMTVVGKFRQNIPGSPVHSFRWDATTGMQDLGTLPGGMDAYALGVSGDGSIVVGWADTDAAGTVHHAFVWSQSTGILDLNSLLPALGVDLTGISLGAAYAISNDGTSIVLTGNTSSNVGPWEVRSAGATWSFPPAPSTVFPNHGPNSGSTNVVITGSHFTGATSVLFGSNPVSFTVDNDNQITANLGATSAVGFVDVTVSNGSLSGTMSNGFDYFIPPTTIGVPCGAPSLTWQGSPTLGQTFTLVTQDLGNQSQLMLFDWSNVGPPRTTAFASPFGCQAPPCPRYVRADSVQALGNNSTFNLAIPNDPSLVGVHVRVQALISGCPRLSTQALDAVIGL